MVPTSKKELGGKGTDDTVVGLTGETLKRKKEIYQGHKER